MRSPKTFIVPLCLMLAAALFASGCASTKYPAQYMLWRKQAVAQLAMGKAPGNSTAMSFAAAAAVGDRKMIESLRKHGQDINSPDPQSGDPALITSILAGLTSATATLLDAGASPDVYGEASGSPALLDAIGSEQPQVVAMLLDHGANPNATHRALRQSPLHSAAVDGDMEVGKMLLDHKADPNVKDGNGVTPLHLAALKNKTEFARLLLQHGADPNAASQAGTTPLIVAQRENNVEIIKILKAAGAEERPDPLK